MKDDTSSTKSLLVTTNTSPNLLSVFDEDNNKKEQYLIKYFNEAPETNKTNTSTTSITATIANNTTNNNSINVNDFQKLKRSHAIVNIQEMDDNCQVTYEKQPCTVLTTTTATASTPTTGSTPNSPITIQPVVSTNSLTVLHNNWIEEDKMIINGIKVRAGNLTKLLEILVQSFDRNGFVLNGTDFPRVFFLMHKWFIDSHLLAEKLFDLYENYEKEITDDINNSSQNNDDNVGLTRENLNENQLKICHGIQYWIRTFPFHFALDSQLINVILKFTALIEAKGHEEHLQFIDMSNIGSYDWMRKLTTRHTMRLKENIPLAFNKIEPDVLASQLTLLEWKTLRRISFSDYKSYAIKGSVKDIPLLERSIQLFNGLSQWIQCMVLSKTTPKQRADIIHKFIEVAKHLRQLQNFNTLMAVVGGICHSALARLSKTQEHLSPDDSKTLNEFMELLSSNYNYAQYRKAIADIDTFWIPIIGIHLKDMISLHTAHLDKLDNDLINFRKMGQLSVIFQNLTDLQNSVPPVQENRDLIKLLQLSLDMNYTEEQIYELSLEREPRTSVSSPCSQTKFAAFADWATNVSTPLDPQTLQKHVNAMVDAVFKNYDHDGDGCISHAEFQEIAQNFPFIDAFPVLDADQDGVISKCEMKSYFLRANYHALKSEFKHDFHETTFYKPTYCIRCNGLLWGIIKQGWKCRECGINAHRHCKDSVVIECRAKRMFGVARQSSNSGAESVRKRSTFRKRAVVKQKATQTEPYDETSISDDDSITSNEDTYTQKNTLLNSKSNLDDSIFESTSQNSKQTEYSKSTKTSSNSGTTNGHRRYTKFSKRRKSLPSGSSNEDPHPVTLIPRGPLICSNSESFTSWLPDRFTPQHNSFNSSKLNSVNICYSDNDNCFINEKESGSNLADKEDANSKSGSIDESVSCVNTNTTTSTVACGTASPQTAISVTNVKSKPRHISLTGNRLPSTVDYDVNIIKTTFYNASNSATTRPLTNYKMSIDAVSPSSSPFDAKKYFRSHHHTLDESADFYFNDFNEYYQLDDDVLDTTCSSADDDSTKEIVRKLMEAENERKKLVNENAKIKQQLESANAEISSLKNEMCSMRKDTTTTSIHDRIDTLQISSQQQSDA